MNKYTATIIKALLLITIIIIFSSFLVRYFTGGETLTEYAQNNPEIAYATAVADNMTELSSSSPEPGQALIPGVSPSTTPTITPSATSAAAPATSSAAPSAATPSTAASAAGPSTPSAAASAAGPATPSTAASSTVPSAPVPDNREIYQPDFYKEPLNEPLIAYITGTSYPMAAAAAEAALSNQPGDNAKTRPDDGSLPPNIVADAAAIAISLDQLCHLSILHYDFNGEVQTGELICNVDIADDLLEIFYELYLNEYQINKMRLIDEYDGDDTLSMLDNNTSCFNYRAAADSDNLSKHALGLAIDINPFYNPYVYYKADGSVYISPAGSEIYADRSQTFPYKIDDTDLCYKLFREHGFIWGGNWNYQKDYQHFQKTP